MRTIIGVGKGGICVFVLRHLRIFFTIDSRLQGPLSYRVTWCGFRFGWWRVGKLENTRFDAEVTTAVDRTRQEATASGEYARKNLGDDNGRAGVFSANKRVRRK